MNLQTYATTQQNYWHAALESLRAEVNFRPPEAWIERLRQKLDTSAYRRLAEETWHD